MITNQKLSNDIARKLFRDVGNDNLASDLERKIVKHLAQLENVLPVRISDLETLKSAFSAASSTDPYYVSPTYYSLTGRRGLWLYKHEDEEDRKTTMLFCLHPNLKETLIAFPPFGENSTDAIIQFMESMKETKATVLIGRAPRDLELINIGNGFKADRTKEKILDWTHPVHTINCNALLGQKGKLYSRIRQAMNKFKKVSAITREIDFREDSEIINHLSRAWEKNTTHYEKYDIAFTKYFQHLVDLANKNPELGLKGIIVTVNGEDKGFSIWEPAMPGGKTANLFASQVTDFKMTNLATFLTVESAKRMQEEGAEFMCLGGSENEGMDRYKRGFIPEISTDLDTIEI